MIVCVLTLLIPVAIAAPQLRPQAQQANDVIPIISLDNQGVNADGSYQWSYETGNGIRAQEQGAVKTEALSVQGSFSYTADDGTPIELTYIADENGFQPQGAHLPTPPPIPPEIQRALEWNAAHPEQDGETGRR